MKRNTPPQYTYRQTKRKEEIQLYRRIALIILGFFVVLFIVWFMGTSFINALSYLSKGNSSNDSASPADNLPLLTPKIDKLPDSINQTTVVVSGSTTSNVSVNLTVNNKNLSTQKADDQGNFTFNNVSLSDGLNLIKVVAKNNQKETKESDITITLDTVKPALVINTPVDGQSFPNTQKNVSVSGTTEADTIIHVNGSQAVVDGNGHFAYNLPVQSGSNEIEINAVDLAGNTQTVKVTVSVDAGG